MADWPRGWRNRLLVIPSKARSLGFSLATQEPGSLALLGMTTGWDSVRNLADLSANDSSALPAIAFVSGSGFYLYECCGSSVGNAL